MKSDEFEDLIKKNSAVCGSIALLEQKVAKIETDFRSLRGKLNLLISKDDEIEESGITPFNPAKNINSLKPFG